MGKFRWAVEPEGQTHRSEAAIDVELHLLKLIGSLNIFFSHWRQDEGADERQADLAAMGVAGEHEINERESRVENHLFHVIRLVAHEQHRRLGIGRNGGIQVGSLGSGVAATTDPQAIAPAFNGYMAINQDGGAVGLKGADHLIEADRDVVVAKDAEALRRLQRRQDLGGDPGGAPGDRDRKWAIADVVSGDQDQVWRQVIDFPDDLFQKIRLGVLLQVDIAYLDDVEVLEAVGKVANGNGSMGYLELMACVDSRVAGQAETGGSQTRPQKLAASEGRSWMNRCGWQFCQDAGRGASLHTSIRCSSRGMRG